jgi:hypothetical protein
VFVLLNSHVRQLRHSLSALSFRLASVIFWCFFVTWPVLALPNRLGDLDADGQPTALDLVRLINHIQGTTPLAPELAPFADLNEDGAVNDLDVAALADAILARVTLPALKDVDQDGIPDLIEPLMGLSAARKDSNNNGVLDGAEDFDRDGLSNAEEIRRDANPFAADTDGDGWPDEAEITAGSDPLDPDSRPRLIVVANPLVKVVLPSSATPSGEVPFGQTIAQPPVTLVLACPVEPSGMPQGLTLAQPPVALILPAAVDPSGLPVGITFAQPPVTLVLAGPLDPSGMPQGLTLAQPPILLRLDAP